MIDCKFYRKGLCDYFAEARSGSRILNRRYCLVEKDKVENIHKGILVQFDHKKFGYSPYNQGRKDVIESLFPDLGKEAEK